MTNKKNNIPMLRFPDYLTEWDIIKLGKLVSIKSGISPSSYEFSEKGNNPFIKVEELNNCGKYQSESRFYSDSNKNIIPKDSVIFPKRGAAILNNKIRINAIPILMDSNLMALICNKEKLNYEFLYYKIIKEKLYKIADTSTLPQLNNKHIEPYLISLPKLPEQQKIASFLTAVDSKIELLQKKKEGLEQYKKGVMQQLFNSPFERGQRGVFPLLRGEDFVSSPQSEEHTKSGVCNNTEKHTLLNQKHTPNPPESSGQASQEGSCLGFTKPDGTNYPDWEEKKLGEIFSILNGYAFQSNNSTTEGVLWVKIADVGLGKMKKDNTSYLPKEFGEKHKKYILLKGDYVVALTRPILNGRLKIAKIDDFFNNSLLNQRVGKIESINNKTFVFYLLQKDRLIKSIENNIAGSDPPNLSPNEINGIKNKIPCLEEQTQIASFLSAIDSKIALVNTQIQNTEAFKKGLLQQLFV